MADLLVQAFMQSLRNFSQDLRFAARILRRNPGFTTLAVLTLALGIGANTAIFTVANALFLRPLPYTHPDRLVLVSTLDSSTGLLRGGFSYPRFQFLVEHSRSFTGLAAFTNEAFSVTGAGGPEQLSAARVSWNFFGVLGVAPIRGRTFRPEEDRAGGATVAIISHGLWTRRFAARADAIGKILNLDSRPYTVIGVAPAGFSFGLLGSSVDVWTPKVFELNVATPQQIQSGAMYLQAVARLAPAAGIPNAQAEMDVLNGEYRRANPGLADSNPRLGMAVDDLREQLVGNVRPMILLLFCAVGLLLLIACANVAGLLLARGIGRRKEIAVRSALGASRGSIVGQLLTESVLISLLGGALGVVFSLWGIHAMIPLASSLLPNAADVRIDGAVLGFSLAVSLATGILFGLTPALQISRVDLNESLREESRGSSSGLARNRVRSALVVLQVALSMMLLIGAGLLIRSFAQLLKVGPGFDPGNVLTMNISLPPAKYPAPVAGATGALVASRMGTFFRQLAEETARMPGVRAAAAASALPVNPTRFSPMLFEGQPPLPLAQRPVVVIQTITPDYFAVMRTPLRKGRVFEDRDDTGAPRVAIVNETLSHRFWPTENAVGKRAYLGAKGIPVEIVGVVGDIKNVTLAGPTLPEMYMPCEQLPVRSMNLMIRTVADPHALAAPARQRLATLDSEQAATAVQTLEEVLAGSRAGPRFTALLLGVFSATAFLLAVIGLYGAISYSVAQRTHEIGIRIALGASRSDILGLALGQALRLAVLGIALGLGASLALTRLLASQLFQVAPTDPATFSLCAIAFALVALLASYIPAQRAARVDPAIALR